MKKGEDFGTRRVLSVKSHKWQWLVSNGEASCLAHIYIAELGNQYAASLHTLRPISKSRVLLTPCELLIQAYPNSCTNSVGEIFWRGLNGCNNPERIARLLKENGKIESVLSPLP